MINNNCWEKEYNASKRFECPCCGGEDKKHACRECHSDIKKGDCWRNDGYCDNCFVFVTKEIPKIEDKKKKLGIDCRCVDKNCAKCLGGNCKDNNCPTHTNQRKKNYKLQWEKSHKKFYGCK